MLDRHPSIWQSIGDLSRLVETQLIEWATKGSLPLKEAVERKLTEYRTSLTESAGDVLKKFLVDRLLITWLEVQVRQLQVMEAQSEAMNRKHQRRLDRAQRRHLDAVAALAEYGKRAA